MKEGWTYKKFADCIDKIPKQRQVKSKDYKSTGLYPIVSQEKELISGYWDDESYLYKHSKPIIIFGDHTKVVKYVDFDFVVGADGTQILSPKSDVDAKFFYYTLLATPIRTLGYARHIKLLKERSFKFPSLSEQQRIVSRLDSAFAHIDELKANAEKQLSEARALFQKALTKAMEPKEGWEERNLGDVAAIFSGYAFKSSVFQKEGKYQVLRIGNIKQNNLRLSDNAVFIDDLDSGVLNKSLLKEGDLVVTQTGTRHKRDYGFVAMVEKDNLLLNQRNACVRFRNKLSAQFFLYYSYTDLYKDSFFANEGGTVGQGNVGLSALKEMKYYTPPLSEQQRIVSRLDSLSAHVRELEEVLQKTIAECDALKQALLRQVFE